MTLRASLHTPLDANVSPVFHIDLPYQGDSGDDWIKRLLDAYRTNIAGVQTNLRDHENCQTLAGQEKDFAIRCNC